jgi:hypothetical protein
LLDSECCTTELVQPLPRSSGDIVATISLLFVSCKSNLLTVGEEAQALGGGRLRHGELPSERLVQQLHQEVGEMHSVFQSSHPGLAKILLAVMSFFFAAIPAQAGGGSNGRGDPHIFRVLDKRGNLVGYTVTDNMVAREINGVWVTFYVHPASGIFNSDAIYLHYLTTDCTGTPYITHYSTFSEGTRVGPKLYYPTDQQQLNPQSLRVVYGDGRVDTCQPASNIPGVYGVATTVDVESFGLETPFTATQ